MLVSENPAEPFYLPTIDEYSRCGFRFVPLVTMTNGAMCALDITILRRDEPHALVTAAGDLDGRVKTLIDALQMPRQCSELGPGKPKPGPDEDPFFVLMEDDKLVYELNVTTDRLLIPRDANEPYRDIFALIRVRTKDVAGNVLSVWS
jgi:hypothetical protein